jgi:Domain of unknown function (DUF4157)
MRFGSVAAAEKIGVGRRGRDRAAFGVREPSSAAPRWAGTAAAIHGAATRPAGFLPAGVGRPLDPATRAFFEPRFGADFSRVRVHDDGEAHEQAAKLNARAFTVGEQVAMGARAPALDTPAGRHLLAHELAHVAQQTDAPMASRAVSHPTDAAKREADRAAACVLEGESVLVSSAPSARVQRAPLTGEGATLTGEIARPDGPAVAQGLSLPTRTLLELALGFSEGYAAVEKKREHGQLNDQLGRLILSPSSVGRFGAGLGRGVGAGAAFSIEGIVDLVRLVPRVVGKLGNFVEDLYLLRHGDIGAALRARLDALLERLEVISGRLALILGQILVDPKQQQRFLEVAAQQASEIGRRVASSYYDVIDKQSPEQIGYELGFAVGLVATETALGVLTEGIGDVAGALARPLAQVAEAIASGAGRGVRAASEAVSGLFTTVYELVGKLRAGLRQLPDIDKLLGELVDVLKGIEQAVSNALAGERALAGGVGGGSAAIEDMRLFAKKLEPKGPRTTPTRVEELTPPTRTKELAPAREVETTSATTVERGLQGIRAEPRTVRILQRVQQEATNGRFRKSVNYHAHFSDERVLQILSKPDAIYESQGAARRLVFRQGGDTVVIEGAGSGGGNVITGYGPSGIRGTSGARALGGTPSEVGLPVTDVQITSGAIPVAPGRPPIAPARKIWP